MDIGAGNVCSKDGLRPELQLSEDGERFLGRGAIGEPETILMGHYRFDHAGRDIEQLENCGTSRNR